MIDDDFDPSELNYKTTLVCDGCEERAVGTMLHHKTGPIGPVEAVLFLCLECHPPKQHSSQAPQ